MLFSFEWFLCKITPPVTIESCFWPKTLTASRNILSIASYNSSYAQYFSIMDILKPGFSAFKYCCYTLDFGHSWLMPSFFKCATFLHHVTKARQAISLDFFLKVWPIRLNFLLWIWTLMLVYGVVQKFFWILQGAKVDENVETALDVCRN